MLDAGALIAIDRGDRQVLAQVEDADRAGDPVRTNAMAVAQVWRDGKGRQGTTLWWSIADGGDGVPARARTRGAGTGGDRSIGLGR